MRKLSNLIIKFAREIGYVYVFYYKHKQERLVKIGVSKTPKARFYQVKNDLPGKLYFIGSFLVWHPRQVEASFHSDFIDKKVRPRNAGPKAGKDEFFRLNSMDKLRLKIRLTFLTFWYGLSWLCFLSLPIIVYLLMNQEVIESLIRSFSIR